MRSLDPGADDEESNQTGPDTWGSYWDQRQDIFRIGSAFSPLNQIPHRSAILLSIPRDGQHPPSSED